MSQVKLHKVAADEAEIRLDRWFKRHYPALPHGRLEKLLRTGQIRVDGKRVKANQRLDAGQEVRVPPFGDLPQEPERAAKVPRIRPEDEEMIRSAVIHMDDHVIALNKPPGLASQGGTGTTKHVDGLLDALRFDSYERPRLVHRLDKDTSGVLLLGRTASAAAALAKSFKSREARKIYWALVARLPKMPEGTIKAPIAKMEGAGGEKMEVNVYEGQSALTKYRVIDAAQRKVAWLSLEPKTGRTHQIRVHCAYMNTPVVGDGKYGGIEAYLDAEQIARQLHLHARAISLPHPAGGTLTVMAPMPRHMVEAFDFFEFDPKEAKDPFAATDFD